MKKTILLLGVAACLVSACDKDGELDQGQALPGNTAVSLKEAVFHPTGGEKKMSVSATSDWAFQGIPDWLTVKDSKGRYVTNGQSISRGTKSFTLSTTVNEEHTGKDTSREALLSMESDDDSFHETVSVEQPCPYLVISTQKPGSSNSTILKNEDNIEFDWNYTEAQPFRKDAVVFTIYSNTDFTVSQASSSPWMEVATGQYKENENKLFELSFVPDSYNNTGIDRATSIVIAGAKDRNGVPLDSYEIDFSQKNVRFIVEAQGNTGTDRIQFAPCYTTPVSVKVDSEIDWELDSNASWLTFDPAQPKGEGNDATTPATTFAVDVNHIGTTQNANPAKDWQRSSIVVNGIVGDVRLPVTIDIEQEPYVFELDRSLWALGNNELVSKNVTLKSSGDWTVSSKPSWIDLTMESGEGGDNQFALAANAQNLSLSTNSGEIVVSSAFNSLSETLTVTQEPFIFNASAENLSLNTLSTDAYNLNINSSGEWAVDVLYTTSPVKDWLALSTASGDGNSTITYRAAEANTYDVDRTALLSIRSVTHENAGIALDPIEINILQRRYVFEVSPRPETLPLMEFETLDAKEYSIEVECSADWTVIPSESWIKAGNRARTSNGVISVTAENNYGFADRTGTVTVRSEYNGVVKEYVYNVTQKAFEFLVAPTLFSEISPVPGSYSTTASVTCSSPWTIDNSGSTWVLASPSSGNGGADASNVTFTFANNLEKAPRAGTILLRSSLGNHIQELSFEQNAFEFDETPESMLDLEALNSSSKTIDVICSAGWSLVGLPSWIAASRNSGTGNGSFTITPRHNYDLSPRQTNGFAVRSSLNGLTKPVSVSQKAFVFDTAGETVPEYTALSPVGRTVTVGDCIGNWSVKNCPSWISVSSESGSGNTSISLTADENYGAARSAVIRIESEYIAENSALCKLVEVSQEAFSFDTNPVTLNSFAALNPVDAVVNMSNTMSTWTVECETGWISVSPMSGMENGSITISIEENVETVDRRGEVRIRSDRNPSLVKVIAVAQEALVFDTTPAQLEEFSALNPVESTLQLVSTMGPWTVENDLTWVHLAPLSGTGNGGITVTVQDNTEPASRTGVIRIRSAKNTTLVKEVSVRQAAFVFDTEPESLDRFDAVPSGAKTFTLDYSMGTWTVDNVHEWIKVSPATGDGPAEIRVEVDVNTSTEERSGSFEIVSDRNLSMKKTVTVRQSAYVFLVSGAPLQFEAVQTGSQTINVQCSGEWNFEVDGAWIHAVRIENMLSVTVDDNDGEERVGIITVYSQDDSTKRVTVTVTQNQFTNL